MVFQGNIGFNQNDSRNEVITKKDKSGRKEDYVVHLRYMEGMYSNDGFTSKDDYRINLNEILGKADISFNPSFLIKGKSNDLAVYEWDRIDYSPLLEIIKWEEKKKKLTFTEKLQTLIFTYFRSIGTLVVTDKSRSGFMRGLEVGTREVETGVKIGSSIMALGSIGVTTEGILFL